MLDAIEIKDVVKTFGAFEAVAGVSIATPPGAFLVLVGPSGCGKSTMLRMLAGLEVPSAGQITFNGTVVANGRGNVKGAGQRDAGLVFQSYALWPHMTVRRNVEWPLQVARWPTEKRRARTDEVLALLDIAELGERYPSEISGGQQQRVAIARMIGPAPRILLFDEPLSNLDAKLRVEMRAELVRIHRATGATSVYVTHDQVEAMTMATHVAVMRNGKVEQFGAPQDLITRPATAFVASFVGTPPGNVLPAVVEDATCRVCGVSLARPEGLADDTNVQIMFRPESLSIHGEDGKGRMPVEYVEASPIAGRTMITGIHDGVRITALADGPPDQRIGETLFFGLPATPAAVYDSAGHRLA